jgi:hypothetical protein
MTQITFHAASNGQFLNIDLMHGITLFHFAALV